MIGIITRFQSTVCLTLLLTVGCSRDPAAEDAVAVNAPSAVDPVSNLREVAVRASWINPEGPMPLAADFYREAVLAKLKEAGIPHAETPHEKHGAWLWLQVHMLTHDNGIVTPTTAAATATVTAGDPVQPKVLAIFSHAGADITPGSASSQATQALNRCLNDFISRWKATH